MDAAVTMDLRAEMWRVRLPDDFKTTRKIPGAVFNSADGTLRYETDVGGVPVKNASDTYRQCGPYAKLREAMDVLTNQQGDITLNGDFYPLVRGIWASLFIDPRARDIYQECGYPEWITPLMYRAMYDREGIAARVVDIFPEECWATAPRISDSLDPDIPSDWDDAWDELEKQHSINHYMERIDKLSGIGHYGILLLGLDDNKLLIEPAAGIDPYTGEPSKDVDGNLLTPNHKLTFLRAFDESEVHIGRYQVDPNSPRYGKPEIYLVRFTDPSTVPIGQPITDVVTHMVHWTRIIHVADNRKSSEIFGMPRMQNVYNRLQDIRKILSGSGEMFWKGAFPGFAFETNPDLMDPLIDKESMREEFANYSRGLQRYLAVTGVTVKSLEPQVSDPTAHIDCQLKSIATSKGIPWRQFVGAEEAQEGSEQDTMAWNKRLGRRQELYISPFIIRPLMNRFIVFGILPQPQRMLMITWEDLDSATDSEKADIFLKLMQGLATYLGGNVDQIIAPMAMFVHCARFSPKLAKMFGETAAKHISQTDGGIVPIDDPTAIDPLSAGNNSSGAPTAKVKTKSNNSGMRPKQ